MKTGNLSPAELRILGEECNAAIKALGYKNVGFVLLTYEYGNTKAEANYISTGTREDCIQFMFETAYRLKEGQDREHSKKEIDNP